MDSTLFWSLFPYAMTLAAAYFIFMSWALWRARFSRVLLVDSDAHIEHVLRSLPHNQRVELLRRGWVLRPEWLKLWRESTSALQPESPVEPGFVRVTSHRSCLKQPDPFDHSVTMTGEDGNEFKFLDDPLAEDYLMIPGETCRAGMLPPAEFEIRALCWEIQLLNTNMRQLTVADQIWNRSECRAHIDGLLKAANDLSDAIKMSPEHRAAFLRVYSDWCENDMCVPERFFQSFMSILTPMNHWVKLSHGVSH